jgi:hypothetical protein
MATDEDGWRQRTPFVRERKWVRYGIVAELSSIPQQNVDGTWRPGSSWFIQITMAGDRVHREKVQGLVKGKATAESFVASLLSRRRMRVSVLKNLLFGE